MLQGIIDKLSYRHNGSWHDLGNPPQLPRNTQLYVKPWWLNSGTQGFKGRVSVEITYPDNSKQTLSATENQDQIALPGLGYGVAFSGFQLNRSGSYKARVNLEEIGYDEFVITGFEWEMTRVGYILGYGEVYYYSPRVTVRNNGNMSGSYIIGTRHWPLSSPTTIYLNVHETNRVALNPGGQTMITLRTWHPNYYLDLWNSYSGYNIAGQIGVVAIANPLLLRSSWNF